MSIRDCEYDLHNRDIEQKGLAFRGWIGVCCEDLQSPMTI